MTFANWTLLLWNGRRRARSLITGRAKPQRHISLVLAIKAKRTWEKTTWLQRCDHVHNLSACSYWGSVLPLGVCKHFSHVKIFYSGNAECG